MSERPRFLSLVAVQRELGLTRAQVTTLIESGELPAFQLLGQWRVEQLMLDQLVDRLYEKTPYRCEHAAEDATITTDDRGLGAAPAAGDAVPPSLTPQQLRICQLLGEGMSNAEIAQELCLEISTVKSHVSRMLQRMNLRERQQLIAHLWRIGFLTS